MALTDTKIKNMKAKDVPYKAYDAQGLYIQVEITGTKGWRYRFKYDGKFKVMTLGRYPRMSLKQARIERNKQSEILEQGFNPIQERKKAKALNVAQSKNTFKELAYEWHELNKDKWTDKHSGQVIQSLEREVFDSLGDLPVTQITAQMVLEVIRAIESRGALEIAKRTLQRVNAVFTYAIVVGKLELNPASGLAKVLKPAKVKHQTALPAKDLPEFLKALDSYDTNQVTRYAINFLILTMTRTSETRLAEWSEIEGDKWVIPADKMKMRREHIVPLSKQALHILEAIEPITGGDKYIFRGNKDNQPMSNNTMLYAIYRMGWHSRATIHGFRTTASTLLNETGFNGDWIEKQLAHAPKNAVRAAYNRAEYLPDRARMLQWWADFLDGARNDNQVIPFKRKA
jgi:integrase